MREPATRSLDQSLVNWREQRIVERLLVENGMAGKSLLDVPCGYGRFWRTFGGLDIRMVGIDLDPEMVRKAAAGPDRNGHSHPVRGNVFTLPFPDASFDAVTCIRLLHLQFSDADRVRILRELARVSRRFVIVSIYQPTPLHLLLRRINGTPGRLRFTTSEQLSGLVARSGLRLEARRPLQRGLHMQTFVMLTK